MTIKSRLSGLTIDIGATDTAIHSTTDRIAVSGLSCYSTAATSVTFYVSPDLTTASGEILTVVDFLAGESKTVSALTGMGFTDNIIAVAGLVGVNATLTYTQYSGDDI